MTDKEFIKQYKSLVHKILNRHEIPVGFEEDVKQEAYIALLKARRDFNPQLGDNFLTYAWSRIDGTIRNVLTRDLDLVRIPARVKQDANKIRYNKDKGLSERRRVNAEQANAITIVPYETSDYSLENLLPTDTISKVESAIDTQLFFKHFYRILNPTSLVDNVVAAKYIDNKSNDIIANEFEIDSKLVYKYAQRGIRKIRNRVIRNGLRLPEV